MPFLQKFFFYIVDHFFSYTHQTSTRAFEHPGFVIRLVLDGSDIKFEPTFPDFEVVLLNVYDVMIKSVSVIPRVETKLYSEWVSLLFHYLDKKVV